MKVRTLILKHFLLKIFRGQLFCCQQINHRQRMLVQLLSCNLVHLSWVSSLMVRKHSYLLLWDPSVVSVKQMSNLPLLVNLREHRKLQRQQLLLPLITLLSMRRILLSRKPWWVRRTTVVHHLQRLIVPLLMPKVGRKRRVVLV